jgi:hypothetical protein
MHISTSTYIPIHRRYETSYNQCLWTNRFLTNRGGKRVDRPLIKKVISMQEMMEMDDFQAKMLRDAVFYE